MSPETYKVSLEQAKQDLADTVAELGEAERKVEELQQRIVDLRGTVTALSKLCGEEFVEVEDALGLTAAIRLTLEDAADTMMTPQDVRLRLESRGFDTRRYGNLLASIHTVLGRLQAKKEVTAHSQPNGKFAYKWIRTPASPPGLSGLSGMLSESTKQKLK
jgi:chromosome segregation ATPase